ncbi:MAG TPA: sporulation protein, partial [Sphingomonas sp.]|nr:sporulation protein [Sphingomonas sp.]
MNPRMLGRISITSLIFGVATVGCTSTAQMNRPAALADRAPQRVEAAARAAGKADTALAAHQSVAAVDAAEKAVAADPNNGGYRLLLGRSYLAAGRFAS